jgi:Tol biopolymer transport system component
MHDDQIRGLLRTLEDDRAPDPAFADALYERLHMVADARRPSRAPFVLLAAALLTILVAGLAVGSGLLRLPETVEASGSPSTDTSGVAVASPSASASPAPNRSAEPSAEPDPSEVPDSVLFAEADGLRIRSQASESGEVLATVRRGQLMASTGERADVDGTSWYQVRIGPGDLEGWISAGPDGSWLRLVGDGAVTFACSGCGEGTTVVSVTPFEDDNITTIGSAADELIEWAWSPDGTRLVAARGMTTLPSRIVVLGGDGAELAELGIGAGPTWSPDGARLAWIGDGGLVVTDDELSPSTVDLGELSNGAPYWSPDGSRFALIANEDPGAIDAPVSLFVVPVGGGEAVRLTEPGYLNGITWSADGSTIGYSTVDLSGLSPTRAFMIAADGGEPRPLLDGAAVLVPPIWSPAGDAIALVTPDGIGLATGDGTDFEILVPAESEQFIGEVLWSPSGEWLLYSLSTGREPSLWIVPADGTAPPTMISPDGAGGQQADWQPVLVPLP